MRPEAILSAETFIAQLYGVKVPHGAPPGIPFKGIQERTAAAAGIEVPKHNNYGMQPHSFDAQFSPQAISKSLEKTGKLPEFAQGTPKGSAAGSATALWILGGLFAVGLLIGGRKSAN